MPGTDEKRSCCRCAFLCRTWEQTARSPWFCCICAGSRELRARCDEAEGEGEELLKPFQPRVLQNRGISAASPPEEVSLREQKALCCWETTTTTMLNQNVNTAKLWMWKYKTVEKVIMELFINARHNCTNSRFIGV